MKIEKSNFARVVYWLREHGKIKNQKDLAERMGVTEPTISRNKHGSVTRPNEDTLLKFNRQFGDIINLSFLRGESDVMLVADLPQTDNRCVGVGGNTTADNGNGMDALLASKEETIAALKRELAAKDALIESLERYINNL